MPAEFSQLIPISDLDPAFLKNLQDIAEQRKSRDESKTKPGVMKEMMADMPSHLLPHVALYFLTKHRRLIDAELKIESLWDEVKETLAEKLGLEDVTKLQSPEVSLAIQQLFPVNLTAQIYSHIIILQLTSQEFSDNQISAEMLLAQVEIHKNQLFSNMLLSINEFREQQTPIAESLPILVTYLRWYFSIRNSLFQLEKDKTSSPANRIGIPVPGSESLKEDLDLIIWQLIEIICGIINHSVSSEYAHTVNQELGEILTLMRNLFEDSPRAVDSSQTVDALMNLIKVYSQSCIKLYNGNHITVEDLAKKMAEIAEFSWEYMVFNSTTEGNDQSGDRHLSIAGYTSDRLMGMTRVVGNSISPEAFFRKIVQQATDPIRIYTILLTTPDIPQNIFEAVRDEVFPKKPDVSQLKD